MDGVHDLGGMHGFGPVVVPGGDRPYHERWEPRVFAMTQTAGADGLMSGTGGRALRETMDPVEYLAASYYERWQWSNERRLERKGAIAEGEVDAWVERIRAGETAPARADAGQSARVLEAVAETVELEHESHPSFAVGDAVRVRRMRPSGHTRCPRYVRGVTGVVEAVRGADSLPDDGPTRGELQTVYAVAFRSQDLFGESDDGRWVVYADLWESYLEAT